MSDTVIKVEDLGKLYRLGEIGTGTISHDLNRWWASVRGKEDPFAKIGMVNDRSSKGDSEYVWALKNINFEVKQGEVLGVIGRNGAGKSTLLKILSKVTTPSSGKIKVKGRIASLLEVGTGFHAELTGRENVFLNGAILGMTKAEIKSKFDEIVDFAGVERYIDTPVKRYSSGMYVRLAFAVAAFLEPEILIVDEVLAVGDADFQKKCMGRMKDVSVNDGRTVLFVSHNMGAIRQLCDTGLVLHNGGLLFSGNIRSAINSYEQNLIQLTAKSTWKNPKEKEHEAYLENVAIRDINGECRNSFISNELILISFSIRFYEDIKYVKVGYDLLKEGVVVYRAHQTDQNLKHEFAEGDRYIYTCTIPGDLLNHGDYEIRPLFSIHNVKTLITLYESVLKFSVELNKNNYFKIALDQNSFPGVVFPSLKWDETVL